MNNYNNCEIRKAVKEAGVRFWEVAEAYGVSDGCFSRKLRKELSPNEKQKILTIIQELAQNRREVG